MYASDMAWRTIPLVVDLHKLGLHIDELGRHRSLGVLRLEVLLVRLGVGHGRPACNHYHYFVINTTNTAKVRHGPGSVGCLVGRLSPCPGSLMYRHIRLMNA